jgi:hypothetical protein
MSPLSSEMIEQATRVHGQCNPDRRRFLWEEKSPSVYDEGRNRSEKLRVNRRQNMVVIEKYVS